MSNGSALKAALARGIVGTAGLRVAQAVLGLVIAAILARLLQPAGYGAYAFAMALVAFLAIPSELGIPGLTVREVAVANAKGEFASMRSFITWSHRCVIIVSLGVMLASAAALYLLRERIEPARLQCMWIGLLLIPFVSLGALRSAMLQGLRKVLLAQLPEQLIRPIAFLTLIVTWVFAAGDLNSAPKVMALQLIAVAVAFTTGLWLFLRNQPPGLKDEHATVDSTLWRSSALAFGLFAAMRLINGRTDVVALGLFHSDAEVGVYRIAAQLATVIIFGLQIVNPIQGPYLAHIYSTGDMKLFQQVVTKTSRIIFFLTIPVFGIVVIFGKPLIAAVFGWQFEGAFAPLVVLAAGQLVNAAMGSVGSVLIMTGHERDTAMCVVAGASINITLNLLLTPQLGMMGAALATSASLITWNLLMWRQVRVRIGVETSIFYGPRH